jgi:hypothetical protein
MYGLRADMFGELQICPVWDWICPVQDWIYLVNQDNTHQKSRSGAKTMNL